jgi:hypothetical protein
MEIRATWRGSCDKHPRYNPRIDGSAGIKGGCLHCQALFDRLLRIFDVVRQTDGVVQLRSKS